MIRRAEQALLAPVYAAIIRLRTLVWRVRRPTLVGVRALVVREHTVLLVRHRHGPTPWSLPGGGVERYERLAEGAAREVREETGLVAQVERLLGMYDSFRDGITNYIAVFVCRPIGEPRPPRSLEIAEARFFSLDELPARLDPGSRRRIGEYLAGEQGISRLW